MLENVKKLAELRAKATQDKWTNADGKRKPGKSVFRASTSEEKEDIYGGPSRYGPNRDYIANFLECGVGDLRIGKIEALANADFTCAAANLDWPKLAARLAALEELAAAFEEYRRKESK
jgi:hypothetical protein